MSHKYSSNVGKHIVLPYKPIGKAKVASKFSNKPIGYKATSLNEIITQAIDKHVINTC